VSTYLSILCSYTKVAGLEACLACRLHTHATLGRMSPPSHRVCLPYWTGVRPSAITPPCMLTQLGAMVEHVMPSRHLPTSRHCPPDSWADYPHHPLPFCGTFSTALPAIHQVTSCLLRHPPPMCASADPRLLEGTPPIQHLSAAILSGLLVIDLYHHSGLPLWHM
jgi:hypothetical protein